MVKASGWIERLETGDAQERSEGPLISLLPFVVFELERDLELVLRNFRWHLSTGLKLQKAAPVVLNDDKQDAVKIQTIHASKGKNIRLLPWLARLKI